MLVFTVSNTSISDGNINHSTACALCIYKERSRGVSVQAGGLRERENRFHHAFLWWQPILTSLNQVCHPWDQCFSNHNHVTTVTTRLALTQSRKTSFEGEKKKNKKNPNAFCPNLVAPSLVVPPSASFCICLSVCASSFQTPKLGDP